MVQDPDREAGELQERITTLEESVLYIMDLANGLPDHGDWLWPIADRMTAEAAELKKRLNILSAGA